MTILNSTSETYRDRMTFSLGSLSNKYFPGKEQLIWEMSENYGSIRRTLGASPVAQLDKNRPVSLFPWRGKRQGFNPWVWKILWRRKEQPTPVFLLGESHGQRSLAGYSPWVYKEVDKTEHTCHVSRTFLVWISFFFHGNCGSEHCLIAGINSLLILCIPC